MQVWKESGFADFADGEFGNGGQNIYVSAGGVLQRIFRFDVNQDGYMDLLFVNSQDFNERPPAYIISDALTRPQIIELPTLGAYSAAIGDLNGDGYDDLVIANQCNGTHSDITAYVYYGSPEGLTERYKLELPAPDSRGVAIGDFNGDGRMDIAFASSGKLRIFYQDKNGFLPGNYTDIDMQITHLAAADLDGDGCSELYVRAKNGSPCVLWGGGDGISLERVTSVGGEDPEAAELKGSTEGWIVFAEGWKPSILWLNGKPHLYRVEDKQACLFPVDNNRRIGEPLRLDCENTVAAAAYDINGNGYEDIVLAVCKSRAEEESSWIYWHTAKGYDNNYRTALPTTSARDVAVADLTGSGFGDVIICQGHTDILNSSESVVFRGSADGIDTQPTRFATHDATTVLTAKTSDSPLPQVIFINHLTGRARGDTLAYVYLGGEDGYSPDRKIELLGWSAPDGVCCDFNDNGWADILLSNCSENAVDQDPGSYIYWGGPDGYSLDSKIALPTKRAHGSAVGDFRHSGHLDLVSVGFDNPELLIFKGGPGGFDLENPQRIMLNSNLSAEEISSMDKKILMNEPRWLLAADFNNNGWLDLFVSQIYGPRCMILWGGPDGFSMDRCTLLSAEGTSCAQAADLTGNGWLDLIIGGHQSLSKKYKYESYIYIYWGGPDGYREDRRTQLPCYTCNSLTIADFNNDGILDIFATSYNAGRDRDCNSYIYWGMPGGVYSVENRTRLWGHSACGCVAADFNEDGWIDLAVAHHKTYGSHPGYSKIWWNGPNGFCEKNVTKLPTNGPHGMTPVDPGNIMDRSNEEYYTSNAHCLPENARVTKIEWDAQIQTKTWVKAQIRFAETRELLSHAPWQGPFDSQQDINGLIQTGRWVQYRLALGAINGGNSPRVTSVSVEYEVVK